MKVIRLSTAGITAAKPEIVEIVGGSFLAFVHGERGRGRKEVRIPLGMRDFPVDTPPDEDEEYLLLQTKKGGWLLVRGRADGKFLVLWSLEPGYRGGADYAVEGDAEVLMEGYEADGAAGRVGGAPCPVVLVSGPCRLSWHRSGRLYGDPADWVAVYDGNKWTVGPEEIVSQLEDAQGC